MAKKRWIMAFILFSSFFLTSCDSLFLFPSSTSSEGSSVGNSSESVGDSGSSSLEEEEHGVPEYRGMTVHRESENAKYATLPFPMDPNGQTDREDLSNLVEFPVETDEELKFYVDPGEWFYLNIYLSNPDAYEIQSFTLNGQKYANYMFAEGSTLDKIVLHLQAPSTPGYFTFHIEAMKYLDNDEIRDVLMDNDTTIQVGIPYDNQPTCLSRMQVYSNGAIFDLTIDDPDNLTKNYPISFYLSDGNTILKEQELHLGDNEVHVPGLSLSSTYQYGVITAYDQADGRNDHAEWLVKEFFTTKAPVSFSFLTPSEKDVQFGLYSDANYKTEITQISLYDGFDLKETHTPLPGEETFSFENLISNRAYSLVVDYAFTLDGVRYEDSLRTSFRTQASKAPQVSLELVDRGPTSLSFRLNLLDEDGLFRLKEVTLSDETGVVESVTEKKDIYTFQNLYSNHTYFVEASYYYDLNDETGMKLGQTPTVSGTTLSFMAPTLEEDKVAIDVNDFTVAYRLTGLVQGEIDTITLLKDGLEIETQTGPQATFTGLQSETEYDVRVDYHYDFGDGGGIHRESKMFHYKTFSELRVLDFRIENDKNILMNDPIFFSIYLNNEKKIPVTKAVINDKVYSVNPLSSSEKVLIQVINDGTLGGGSMTFHLDGLYFLVDGEEVFMETDFTSEAFFINGVMKFLDARIVDKDLNPRTYCFSDEKLYIELFFQNESEFRLVSINEIPITEFDVTMLSDEHYLIGISSETGASQSFTIDRIGYKNDNVEGELLIDRTFSYVILSSKDIVEIDSVEDLEDLDDYRYYRLVKDIDLSGTGYVGSELKGYFDGNGHTISNMTFTGNMKGGSRLGLFTTASGVITSLNIENFFFNVGFNDTKDPTEIGLGLLAGEGKDLAVKDCTIDSRSMLSFACSIQYTYSIGGFIGIANRVVSLENCVNAGNYAAEGQVGGFIGRCVKDSTDYNVDIRNCKNEGLIYGKDNVGGFIGMVDYAGTLTMENVLNTGKVQLLAGYQSNNCGAIIGYSYYSTHTTMKHAVNTDDIETLLGSTQGDVQMDQCLNLAPNSYLTRAMEYFPDNCVVTINRSYAFLSPAGEYLCTEEQIKEASFFEMLEFDSNIWDFDIYGSGDDLTISVDLLI